MTDTWGEAIERLNAASSPAPMQEAEHAPVTGPASWPLYAGPTPSPEPAPAQAQAQASDPLILELEHAAPGEAAPGHLAEAPASVFGRNEPPPMDAAHQEAAGFDLGHAPPAPVQDAAAPAPAEPEPPVFVPPPMEPAVAQVEKVVELAPASAEPVAIVAPAPVPAPIVVAAQPQSARPALTESPHESHDAIDPVLAGFDHVVALAGYVLLFISVFMFGVPALATMALAYAHKNDSHLLVRSHYRFQLRIFWTAVLFVLLAIGSAVTAGGLAVTKLVEFARDHLPGVSAAMDQAHVGSLSPEIAGLLVIGAVMLGVLALLWTLIASVFGFLRLVANRPIGHQYASK